MNKFFSHCRFIKVLSGHLSPYLQTFRLILFIFISVHHSTKAQSPFGVPPSIILKQIDTDTVRVIYPSGWDDQAQRVVSMVHYLAKNKGASLGNKHRKLELVIQNHTTISNGYVALAPFRSEFFATPFQNGNAVGTLNWLDALTIHEYRHALQYMNGRRGLNKVMYFLGGDYALQVPYALTPNWFYEGDAVMHETLWSKQGRGRLPVFYNAYRGLFEANKKYRYIKAENGSYKDFVPTHYELGYMLVSHGWNTFGSEFWKNVFLRNSRQAALIYGFSRAINKESGGAGRVSTFYKQAYDEAKLKWEKEKSEIPVSPALKLNKKEKTVTNYSCLVSKSPGEWLVLRSRYNKIPYICLLNKHGEEKDIVSPGFLNDDYFSYRNNQISWAELRVDPRWSWKNYSVIMLYDMNTKKKKQLSFQSKYFSPDISHNGQSIAVVEVSPEMKYKLLILDASTGAVKDTIANPANLFMSYPRWSHDDQYLYVTVKKDPDKIGLFRINVSDNRWEEIVPFSVNSIAYVVPARDRIYFSASFNGLDNVFSVIPGQEQIYQHTSRHTGAYYPAINADANELAFIELTSTGSDVYIATLDTGMLKTIQLTDLNELSTFQSNAVHLAGEDVLSKNITGKYKTKNYRRGLHLFKFHSWPIMASPPAVGISLLSNNVLNTARASLSYSYNTQQNHNSYEASFSYGGWYPVFHLLSGIATGKRTGMYKYNETYQGLDVQLPLTYVKNMYSGGLGISVGIRNNQLQFVGPESAILPLNRNFTSFNTRLTFANNRKMAYQHILSHFGQRLGITYNKSISNFEAEQLSARLHLIFRGFWINHNFTFETAYQQIEPGDYTFADNMVYSRGYELPSFEHIYRLSFNYHFPLFYPDAGIPGIIYLLRARTNLFYDFSEATVANAVKQYNSLGTELFFDAVFFSNTQLPVGLRFSYLLNPAPGDKNYSIEPLISISF